MSGKMKILWRRRKVILALMAILSSLLLNSAWATIEKSSEITTEHTEPVETQVFTVDEALIRLNNSINVLDSEKGNQDLNDIERQLSALATAKAQLNPAEKYLYLLAQANFIEKKAQLQPPMINEKQIAKQVIALLVEAKTTGEVIDEGQLSQPEFLQLHEVLAQKYADLAQYDLAYQEKRFYLIKYDIYRQNKREAMLASLTQDFAINEKKSLNDSLLKQNEQQVKRVDEVEKEKATQQYHFMLVVGTALIFVALFFRQLHVRQKLITLAKTDVLTGVLNRSALFEHGYALSKRHGERHYDLSILLLDIDNFKKINDSYGHHVGDQVIKTVASLVSEAMRTRDVFARLGGEEFVALLPFADHSKAKAIAQRINEKVAQHDFSEQGLTRQVTLSIGIATMNSEHSSFEEVLHCADLAMYQAKAQGKNCVFSYQNISSSEERRGI